MKKWLAQADIALRSRKMTKRGLQGRGEIELNLLDALIEPGFRCLDIGANKGVYTYQLQKFGPVTAFEPNPDLAHKIRIADFPKVSIESCAVSDVNGTSQLTVPFSTKKPGQLNSPAGSLRAMDGDNMLKIDVPVHTLDHFAFTDVGFVKVDAEGWEEHVLRGAKETIERCRPIVMLELVDYVAPGCRARVPVQMAAFGYEGFFVDDRPRTCVRLPDGEDVDAHIQNFMFAPASDVASLVDACNATLAKL